jgi:capsular exopolysaccharide synthesis family protein
MHVRQAPGLPSIEASELRPYLKLLWKNAWVFAVLGVAGYVSGRLVTHRQLDIHSATAELLLKPEEGDDVRMRMLGELNGKRATDDVQNQLRIVKSYDLVGQAVDRLGEPLDCFFVGRIRTTQVPAFSNLEIAALPGLFHPEMLGRDIDLFVENDRTYRLVYTRPGGEEVEEVHTFGMAIEGPDVAMTVRYVGEPTQLDAAKRQHFRIRVYDRDGRIAQFRSGLTVENVERTSILTLRATSTLPGRAKQFLDTLAAAYIGYTQDAQLESGLQTEGFIDRRLTDLVAIMDSLERETERYRASHQVLDLDREQTDQFNALVSLEAQQRTLDVRIASVSNVLDAMATGADQAGLPPVRGLVSEDPALAQLIARLADLRSQRTAALIDVTPENYQVRRLDSALRSTQFTLKRYLEDSRRSMQAEQRKISGEVAQLEQKLGNIPAARRDLLALERKLEVNEDLYVFLLEAKANTFIQRAGVAPSASIVEQARSGGIVGPDKRRTIAIHTGLGLLFAAGIAVLRFLFFTRIESLDELKDIATLPVLGAIPHYESIQDQSIAILSAPRSEVTEAFRGIRTGLNYSLPRERCATVLVSSLHPGEGKSFVSSNLAAVLAKAGKRVALLDFDLHKPKIHTYLHLPNRKGISSYLMGDCDLNGMCQTGPIPTLDVFTSGPIPPTASELVLNPGVNTLLEDLRKSYDYIVLDTPPLLLITDALVLMQHADAGLFVLNTSRANHRAVRKLEELLSASTAARATLILNNVRLARWQRVVSRYATKYGYGYGYGYGGYRSEESSEQTGS